jgi:predicted TIM-barrel fold metal-dependent hydrolase
MSTPLRRRAFLGRAGLGLGAVVLRPDAAAQERAPAPARPDLTIIDTHTHFYDPRRPEGVPWPPKDDPLLYRTVLPTDYDRLPKPAPVAGTVVVEASPWVEDNQWILNLAAQEPSIVGFVGNLPVGDEAFPRLLERFAANILFRGLRVGEARLREGLGQDVFLAHLRVVAERGLTLDVVGAPTLLPEVERLAARVPDLRVVIDHLAGVQVDGQAPPERWRRELAAAARHPNVHAKVSGLVEGTGRADGTAPGEAAYYAPVLDTLVELFGADRLIYGSNWPVSERFAPLARVQGIVAASFGSRGGGLLAKAMSANARTVYGWWRRR